jgi:hypothetical protein
VPASWSEHGTPGVANGEPVVKKIRLNDEQWNTLQALLEAHAQQRPTDAIKVSERLMSMV